MQKEKSTSRKTELGRNENHAVSGKEGREVRMILEAGMARGRGGVPGCQGISFEKCWDGPLVLYACSSVRTIIEEILPYLLLD